MEESKKANSGIEYKNGKYRPSVFISKEREQSIKNRYTVLGFKSANEYINFLINKDLQTNS